jgi:hypothetical protein
MPMHGAPLSAEPGKYGASRCRGLRAGQDTWPRSFWHRLRSAVQGQRSDLHLVLRGPSALLTTTTHRAPAGPRPSPSSRLRPRSCCRFPRARWHGCLSQPSSHEPRLPPYAPTLTAHLPPRIHRCARASPVGARAFARETRAPAIGASTSTARARARAVATRRPFAAVRGGSGCAPVAPTVLSAEKVRAGRASPRSTAPRAMQPRAAL